MIILILGVSIGSYLFGRVQGYEKCEKDDQQSKAFWKEVEKDGIK